MGGVFGDLRRLARKGVKARTGHHRRSECWQSGSEIKSGREKDREGGGKKDEWGQGSGR